MKISWQELFKASKASAPSQPIFASSLEGKSFKIGILRYERYFLLQIFITMFFGIKTSKTPN